MSDDARIPPARTCKVDGTAALQALIAKWRRRSRAKYGERAYKQCADELEAALSEATAKKEQS